MRAKQCAVRAALFLLMLAMVLWPVATATPVEAKVQEQVAVGSIAYAATAASVIGFVTMNNPGFEKNVVYQFPSPPSTSWSTPFFTDLDIDDVGGHVMGRHFDSMIVLTNTSSTPGGVDVSMTFFNQAGAPINGTDITPIMVHIDPKGTQVRFVSSLLNP